VTDAHERTAGFLLGLGVAALFGGLWRIHRRVLAVGARMVGRCHRCKRSYTFSHPSQAKLARQYHNAYDCPNPTEEEVA
jgi:hypothetical protein